MPIQERSTHSALITEVTGEQLRALLPWVEDRCRRFRRLTGNFETARQAAEFQINRIRQDEFGFLSLVALTSTPNRWAIIDVDVNLWRQEVLISLHPGQPDVDIQTIAETLDKFPKK